MCGIVGYVGPRQAAPILLDGLRKLEYRGYDSAGLAVHDGQQVEIVRAVGKLENLSRAIETRKLHGTTGLGHTRWATHGRPSEPNAHPHAAGDVAVVHNGIIENHLELKHELEPTGCALRATRTPKSPRTSCTAPARTPRVCSTRCASRWRRSEARTRSR